MRILIAGSTYSPAYNGQAIFTVTLAEGLARRGHDVIVLTQSEQGRPYQTTRNGVRIYALRALPLNRWYPGAVVSLIPGPGVDRIIRTHMPDIVHIQDHYPISQSAYKVARSSGIPVIGTNHFMPENLAPYFSSLEILKPFYEWGMWRWMLSLYNRLDAVTAPSRTAVEILRRQGLSVSAFAISCGVDLQRFCPDGELNSGDWRARFGLDTSRVVFLYVGRVDGEKRLDVLLHALRRLERDDIQLAIAGRGAARNSLETLAAELGLGEKVRFLGFVPDETLPALLNSVDVFAMPSEAELLSIASLEAMACGRPLLAARAQALPELVTDGENGFLFRPSDPLDAAQSMARMADFRERLPEMGLASTQKVQVHSRQAILERYDKIYHAVITQNISPMYSRQLRESRASLWGKFKLP